MKFEDGPLKNYLIKNLQPLTAADPSLLANYVAALLKNNKPKKELQKLCIDKLFDFLGDGTKQFVSRLFHDLEEGSLSEPAEGSVLPAVGDTPEPKNSPSHVNKTNPSTTHHNDPEESSDDEDDDRNHKHRRRVSRSRSFDKDAEEGERSHHRKRSRSTDNGQYAREGHRHYEHRRPYRGRDHSLASRIVVDGSIHGGMRGGLPYRGEPPGPRFFGPGLQRGIGGRGTWLPPDQRFGAPFPDGSELLLPQGPSASNIFSGRVSGGRGAPQPQWAGFGLLGNGALEHVLPLNTGRNNSVNPINMAIPLARPRCLDFEERGYCLRGDLCPMEHGANRIVVEDVQSLSKLTLPISNTRNGVGTASAPTASVELTGRGGRANRETMAGDDGNPASTVSDSYDPDQPLWGKEPDKVRQYHSERQRQDWENSSDVPADEALVKGVDGKGIEAGVSVWDRIGPVEYRRMEAAARAAPGSNGERVGMKRQRGEEQAGPDEGPSVNGHMINGTEKAQTQRSAEGTSYAGTGGGRGDRGGKAQRTLYVGCIPTDCNKTESLRAHFQKFGEVLDIRIPPHQSDRAFVQFARRESAEAALASPEAVMGNRFIRLSWANRDNRLEPGVGRQKTNVQPSPQVAINGNSATAPEAKKPVPANGVALQSKLEELEQMKEEIRKKQEALASKRDEFKRRLEKLAKQGAGTQTTTSTDVHPAEESNKESTATLPSAPKVPKSPFSRATAAPSAWGPSRYKLDNRTTAFRILSPPPPAVSDVAALKEHFATFGELCEVEANSTEGQETIQVSFATRRDAEKAFSQGKLWQGHTLEFAWVTSTATLSTTAAVSGEVSNDSQQPEEIEQSEQEQEAI